jgi:hypothetical protein
MGSNYALSPHNALLSPKVRTNLVTP